MLSPTHKQRNEDFRKLFKQLPDTERLIVGEGIEGHALLDGSSVDVNLCVWRGRNMGKIPLFFHSSVRSVSDLL